MTPLGGDSAPPQPRHLDRFWEECEAVLQAIDKGVILERLPKASVVAIAPHILGGAAWELLSGEPFRDWSSFKEVVEENFGISEQYRGRQVWMLERNTGEDDVEFVLRAEHARMKSHTPKESLMPKMWPQLSKDFRERIDDEAERLGLSTVTWPLVVQRARKM